MRVLVVGGLGFIGYTLSCQLIEEEIDVFVLDNISNEHKYKEEKLLQIGRNAFFRFNSLDTDYRTNEEIDVIVYCLFDPTDRQRSSNMENCIEQTEKHLKNALNYCHEYGSKFILISSNEGFDDHFTEKEEETKPISDNDRDLYLIQEQLVLNSFKDKDEQFIILRFNSANIEKRKVKQSRTFYLKQTKDKSDLQIITNSKDEGEKSEIFTKWLKDYWKKED